MNKRTPLYLFFFIVQLILNGQRIYPNFVDDTSRSERIWNGKGKFFPNSKLSKYFLYSDTAFNYHKPSGLPFKIPFCDIAFVGRDHPVFPFDNTLMMVFGVELVNKSPYLQECIPFSEGKSVLKNMILKCKEGKQIRNLVLVGHSSENGYFVKSSAGIYTNDYKYNAKGELIIFEKEALKVKELQEALLRKEISFHPDASIILVGCNTAKGENNIASAISKALKIPVVGAMQKVSLMETANFGEGIYSKELQRAGYVFYIPNEDRILRYELLQPNTTVSALIEEVNFLKKQLISSTSDGAGNYIPKIK